MPSQFCRYLPSLAFWLLILSFISLNSSATPKAGATTVTEIDLPANDLIYDDSSGNLFASVSTGPMAGSVVPIDPSSGFLGTPISVGNDPHQLAVSDDGQYLYVGVDGQYAISRVDMATLSVDFTFLLGGGTLLAEDIKVMPGNPQTVAVSLFNECCIPHHEGVAIYDDGAKRPVQTDDHLGSNLIAFPDVAHTLYGLNTEGESGFRTMSVDASGVDVNSVWKNLVQSHSDIVFEDGLIYGSVGQAIDPVTLELQGTSRDSEFRGRILCSGRCSRFGANTTRPNCMSLIWMTSLFWKPSSYQVWVLENSLGVCSGGDPMASRSIRTHP